MSETIDSEARTRSQMPLDLDNMAQRYQTENTLYTFTSPSLWTIEKNLFYLLKHSYEISLNTKYFKKPWLLAYDQYGTVTLEYLLMYINGVFSAEEFDIPIVILPTMSAIVEICKDKYTKISDPTTLEKVIW